MKKTSVYAHELRTAWNWREELGLLSELEALRVFHGPGEGTHELSKIAIDRFGRDFWVTEWSSGDRDAPSGGLESLRPVLQSFFGEIGARSAVTLGRPEKGLPEEPKVLYGDAPQGRFPVSEGPLRLAIQVQGARHPGLFLDHLPLRRWLLSRMKGLRVLNTFSYTGSLSVAAGLGGAAHVTTLDLSNPILAWAKENWTLNGLSEEKARFISGDYFEWLPRLKKREEKFDCVILDPPSFSRSSKGTFSTSKDLRKLHAAAFDVLAEGGFVVSSINSANVPSEKFESEVFATARERGIEFQLLHRIELPETFPTRLSQPEQRYLKGLILRRTS